MVVVASFMTVGTYKKPINSLILDVPEGMKLARKPEGRRWLRRGDTAEKCESLRDATIPSTTLDLPGGPDPHGFFSDRCDYALQKAYGFRKAREGIVGLFFVFEGGDSFELDLDQ